MKTDQQFRDLFNRADNCPSRILILLQWIENNGEIASKQDVEDILVDENILYSQSALSASWRLLERKGLIKFNRHGYSRLQNWHEVRLTLKGKSASANYRITHRFWKHR